MSQNPELDAAIADIADDLRPYVASLEARPAITRNHYGAYLDILTAPEDRTARELMALALIKAGANKQGVSDALGLF